MVVGMVDKKIPSTENISNVEEAIKKRRKGIESSYASSDLSYDSIFEDPNQFDDSSDSVS